MKETIKFGPQPGPQTAFMASDADLVVYGGARGGGKTYGLCLDAHRYVQNPEYGAVIFRRTAEQVFQEGGLWETAERIYPYSGGEARRAGPQFVFPSGATISFGGLEHDDSKHGWLGSQIAYLGFDQLEAFTKSQLFFMLGCNRSTCGVRPCVRATANPEPGWLADLLQWWWNPDTGYPILERSGVVRWFAHVRDRIFWADTAAELRARFPGEDTAPKSMTFIPSFVDDNPALLESDPNYKANLYAQGSVEQERWLKGNWKVKMTGGLLLQRGWFSRVVEQRPARFDRLMRYWDLAATEETDKNKNPCYTAGALVGLAGGVWYVCNIQRVRSNPPEVEDLIRSCAAGDPRVTEVRIEKEPGASGKFVLSHFQRNVLAGYAVSEGDLVWNRKSKTERARAVATAARAGNVVLVREPGADNSWIENFLTDCDSAPDGWMDMIDAVSGAFGEMRNNAGAAGQQRARRVELPESVDDHRTASSRRGILV